MIFSNPAYLTASRLAYCCVIQQKISGGRAAAAEGDSEAEEEQVHVVVVRRRSFVRSVSLLIGASRRNCAYCVVRFRDVVSLR